MIAQHSNVSRETLSAFGPFCELLQKWTSRINLIAPSTVNNIIDRHVLDCLRLVPHVPVQSRFIVDFGSGAGFPGLVVAKALADACWQGQITLVESDSRKCAFLAEAARILEVKPTILNARIERLEPLGADAVMARALAPLDTLLQHFVRHAGPSAVGLFLKGETARDEVRRAKDAGWTFDLDLHQEDGTGSTILIVRNVGAS